MCILHSQCLSFASNHIPHAWEPHVADGYPRGQHSQERKKIWHGLKSHQTSVTLYVLFSFPHHPLGKRYPSPHFTDEDTETLRD